MNKFRIGLLFAAALCAYPALASAQQKPAAKPAAAAEDEGEGEEGEADEEGEGEGEEEEGEEAPEPEAPPAGGDAGLGAICKIDPSRCVMPDMKAEAKKDLNEQIYAVQQIYAKRKGRFEITPYWALTLNDQYVKHPGAGVALNFYFSEVMAVGANFNYYRPFNVVSEFNADVRRAARVGVPLTEYNWSAALNLFYVPAYGKFAGFGDFIFHWDLYLVGGVGGISTRPIAVIDPDNRFFEWRNKLMFDAGLGARIFFNRWFAAILEVRDYIFIDELEDLSPATGAQATNQDTWYGEDQLTNNVQAQFGVSIFLPFSFEYRLPK